MNFEGMWPIGDFKYSTLLYYFKKKKTKKTKKTKPNTNDIMLLVLISKVY